MPCNIKVIIYARSIQLLNSMRVFRDQQNKRIRGLLGLFSTTFTYNALLSPLLVLKRLTAGSVFGKEASLHSKKKYPKEVLPGLVNRANKIEVMKLPF